jgi:hypothetical protein
MRTINREIPYLRRNPTKEYILAELPSLREEIISSQLARTNFLQYKLIGIATLASAGLGFGFDATKMKLEFLLPIIPFFCVYVDTICYHNNIRVFAIAAFLKKYKEPYEDFIAKLTEKGSDNKASKIFEMEDGVLRHSTNLLSAFIYFCGLVIRINMIFTKNLCYDYIIYSHVMMASGLFVFILSNILYDKHQDNIIKLSEKAETVTRINE